MAAGTVRIFDTTLRDGEQAPGAGADRRGEARGRAPARAAPASTSSRPGSRPHRPATSRPSGGSRRRPRAESRWPALARCRDGDPQRAVEAIGVAERPAPAPVHRDQRHPPQAQAEDVARGRARRRAQVGGLGARDARPRRRDRVLRRGRVAHRGVVPARGLPGRRRGGRLDRQHPRHRRLRDPRRVRRARRPRRRPRRPRRDRQRPLPQRPRARDREHARRPSRPARARSRSRSTASASAPATRRWRRSSWPSGRVPTSSRSSPRRSRPSS